MLQYVWAKYQNVLLSISLQVNRNSLSSLRGKKLAMIWTTSHGMDSIFPVPGLWFLRPGTLLSKDDGVKPRAERGMDFRLLILFSVFPFRVWPYPVIRNMSRRTTTVCLPFLGRGTALVSPVLEKDWNDEAAVFSAERVTAIVMTTDYVRK